MVRSLATLAKAIADRTPLPLSVISGGRLAEAQVRRDADAGIPTLRCRRRGRRLYVR
jgi:hypothetical protein